MATKLYLTAEAAPYVPATVRGAWDQTSGHVTRALDYGKFFTTTDYGSVAIAETNAAANWDVLLVRAVSGPLAAQTIDGTLDVLLGVDTSSAAADFAYHVHVYVTQGDSDTPRGTLLTDYVETTANEWPSGDTVLAFAAPQTLSAVVASAGDRIVIEIGYVALNSVTTSYTGEIFYGVWPDDGLYALPDAVAGGNPFTTPQAGFFAFSDDITWDTTLTARVSHLFGEASEDGGSTVATGRVSHLFAEVMTDNEVPPVAPIPGGTLPPIVEPPASPIPTGVTRIMAVLTYGATSPQSKIKLTETPFYFDPPSWYGGYGYPWLVSISDITRELSDSIRGTEVTVRVGDPVYFFRTLATTDPIAGSTLELFLVSDTVRYALGEPHRRFAGKVHDHRALPNLEYEFVVRDILSEELGRLGDAPVIPPDRLTATKFPGMTADYENRAVPIALGEVSDESAITPIGVVPPLIVAPLMNLTAFGGSNIDVVGAIMSHGALAPNGLWRGYYNTVDDPYTRIPIPPGAWGTIMIAPGFPGWSTYSGVLTDYIDYPATPSLTHRYTPIFFLASDPNVQAFVDGRIQVAFNLYGVTDEADGSGLYFADAPDIYEYLIRNFLYQPHWRYGAYNTMPTFPAGYSYVNHDSVVTSRTRLRAFMGSPTGYPVGFLLGRGGQQQTLKHVLNELSYGVLMEQGIDRHGRILLDVEDIDASATINLSDLLDIADGFTVTVDRASYRNNAEEVHGYRYLPAIAPLPTPPAGETLPPVNVGPHNDWSTVTSYTHTAAVTANQGQLTAPLRIENYVVRDSDVALDRVQREVARLVGPSPTYDGQRLFRLTTSWQALDVELGDVIAIDHFEGMGAAGYASRRARVLKITDNLQDATITLEGRILFGTGSPA